MSYIATNIIVPGGLTQSFLEITDIFAKLIGKEYCSLLVIVFSIRVSIQKEKKATRFKYLI